MAPNLILISIFIALFSGAFGGVHSRYNLNISGSHLAGIELPDHASFNSDCGCGLSTSQNPKTSEKSTSHSVPEEKEKEAKVESSPQPLRLHLKRRETGAKSSVIDSTARDSTRIQTLHRRISEKKNQSANSRLKEGAQRATKRDKSAQSSGAAASPKSSVSGGFSGQLMATLESGVTLGSGEYFMDVFIGTPPKHFSLILDTGSDLNWIQCVPCHDCFDQTGPHYDPKLSSSFRHISCRDPRCGLVSAPENPPPPPCKSENQTCPYYYWYGDSSNTTGDFALETFTVNLTATPIGKSGLPESSTEFKPVKNVMFGCGHWNRGLFHGAAGLLGLGRGPLSFSSQLQSLYGHSFSYCLVDRNSNTSVNSKLIFGEDEGLLSHPQVNFTSLVAAAKENPVDTFYYVHIQSIEVGGEALDIPEETWNLTSEGGGGTIVDSGTTLSYFAEPAYEIIRDAFVKKVKGYPEVKDFPILSPCYNVSGAGTLELPTFGIRFKDGAVWNFPVENYFIRLEPEAVVCLAVLGTPRSALSIIGNYQQQNFHILYDTKKSRLGFAPTNCADL